MPQARIVIFGAGPIGRSFAAVFSDHDAEVLLVDPDATSRAKVPDVIAAEKRAIAMSGQLRGGNGPIEVTRSPPADMRGIDLALDCGPEQIDVKQAIFKELVAATDGGTILATASSAIPMSRILPEASDQSRALVAHPINPPSVLRIVELCPAPGTKRETTDAARSLFERLGFAPVVLGFELEGFVLNRLQGAVLREAYRLVDEGVLGPNEIDRVMTLGLGPRWALSGPFETAELNAPGGVRDHAARMGPAYRRIGKARGESVDWRDDLIETVADALETWLPAEDREARRAWRSRAVARLVAARNGILDDERGN